jgi:site-specific recombinase XerD
VVTFLTAKHGQFIPELVVKFLNYQGFVRTASPLTLKAYETDLTQAYGLAALGFFQRPAEIGGGKKGKVGYSFHAETPQKGSEGSKLPVASPPFAYLTSGADLLKASRQAQTQWSALASASRNRKAACLKSFLKWLYQESETQTDLSLQLHTPKVAVRVPNFLSVDEITSLLLGLRANLKAAKTEAALTEAQRDLVLVLLLYGGGLRVSEASAMKWSDIDKSRRVLRILGKGGKERLVVVPPLVLTELSLLKNKGPYVWGELALPTRLAYEIVRRAGARADLLKPLHPHALRHSFATHLLSSGTNLRTLQELLQETQKYTHLGIDQLARTIETHHPLGQKNQPKKTN